MLRRTIKSAWRRVSSSGYQTLNRVELNSSRLISNIALIQRQHQGFTVIPVLKGNAYGHGIGPVARILQHTSCRMLAVDGYFEAEQIRSVTRHRVLVMGYILPQNVRLLDTKGCSFVLQDIASLHAFGSLGRRVSVHVELNTGMNRLGLAPGELSAYLDILKTYPKLRLDGVMSHLADADNPVSEDFNRRQAERFDELVEQVLAAGFHPSLIHIAQSAGSVKVRSRYANAIRLGIGAYGINPLEPGDPHHPALAGLQPVLELKSTIIKVLDLVPGDKVGYNCTFTAHMPMRVGVLPLGYYEGVPRALSNTGRVTHEGQELPVVGRICMNHTMVDLSGTKLQVGSEVTVISNDSARPNSVAGMQAQAGLFSYATLTGISSTIKRKTV